VPSSITITLNTAVAASAVGIGDAGGVLLVTVAFVLAEPAEVLVVDDEPPDAPVVVVVPVVDFGVVVTGGLVAHSGGITCVLSTYALGMAALAIVQSG